MIVASKAEFFRRSRRGEFGNHIRTWTWDEYLMLKGDEMPVQVSVRNCIRGGDDRVQRYRLAPIDATKHCLDLLRRHIVPREALILDESAPDIRVVLQAEVRNSERGLDMRYALHSGVGMRQAFDSMRHVSGLQARLILKKYLDAPSLDCLDEILEVYVDSQVELGAYQMSLGVFGWNTVFWEVRNY